MAPAPRSRRRSALLAVTLLLAACSAPGGASPDATGSPAPSVSAGSQRPTPRPLPSAEVLPGTLGTVEVGSKPCAQDVSPDGQVFVSDYGQGIVVRVDPAAGTITQLARVAGAPCGIAYAGGFVWVGLEGTHKLLRLDPESGELLQTIDLKGDPWDVQAGGGYVWVADRGLPGVVGYDEKTGEPGPQVVTGDDPCGLAYQDGHVWVALFTPHKVIRLNAAGDAEEVREDAGTTPCWFGDGDGASLWLTDGTAGDVLRIDPATGATIATIHLGGAPRDPAVAFGALWVANGTDGVLSRISPETNKVTGTVMLAPGIFVVEPVGDEVWVENFARSEIYRVDPSSVGS